MFQERRQRRIKPHNSTETPAFSVFGFRIERKFDIIATTAFILALVGATAQTVSFFRGSNVTLYAPDNIILFFDSYPNGDLITRIAATLNYVNSGEAPYSAIIQKETVQFHVGDGTYQQSWQSFQRFDRAGTAIEFHRLGDAQPTPVPGASAVSHSTIFAPTRIICKKEDSRCDQFANYISKAEFLKSLATGTKLQLEFTSGIVGYSHPLTKECRIEVDAGLVALLMMNQWYSAACIN